MVLFCIIDLRVLFFRLLTHERGDKVQIPGWIILNFYTALLLVLLLIFERKTIHTEAGDRFISLDVMTLVLLASETIGHIGEIYPEKYLILTKIGYYVIYALDPADYLFAILYINCWLGDNGRTKGRRPFVFAYWIFVITNFALVTISTLFNLKWFYYFDGTTYCRGPLFITRAVFLMIFCLLLTLYTVVYRESIYADYRKAIFSLPTLAAAGAFLQIAFTEMNMTYASIAIGLLILFFQLQSKNLDVDYLTGALNRRGLDIRLEEAIKNAQMGGRTFSAIMLDLDHFKQINDTYGHIEGDYALKKVAEILFEVFSQHASIGRFGGDEFCILAGVQEAEKLADVVDIVEDELEKWNYKKEKPYQIEVSMGSMVYDPSSKMSAKEFQMAIDELMYNQKRKHHLADNRRQGEEQ
ncbi:GGDEF domain-containing protein [Butyrivibrio sp. CB08]|nr:GGDEF domain-containing protein [Butyrivibrio sp. CB08]